MRFSEAEQYWKNASEPRLALLRAHPQPLPGQPSGAVRSQLDLRREALEVERRAVKHILCELDMSLNDLQPVNSLPSDVLTHIFVLVMEDTAVPSARFTSALNPRTFTPKWLNLVSVCKRWRSEAFACASLWTHLTTSMRPKMLKDYVRLSQDASLSVVTETSRYRGTTERLDAIFVPAVLDRTRYLSVAFGGLGNSEGLPSLY